MALHKNYVEANIILADSNDAYSSVLHLSYLHSLFLIICRQALYECDTSASSYFEWLQECDPFGE